MTRTSSFEVKLRMFLGKSLRIKRYLPNDRTVVARKSWNKMIVRGSLYRVTREW